MFNKNTLDALRSFTGRSIYTINISLPDAFNDLYLPPQARRMVYDTNARAAGNSEFSEAFSVILLYHLYGNKSTILLEAEIPVKIDTCWLDLYLRTSLFTLGVSVTRAMSFGKKTFDKNEALRLLTKKTVGLLYSAYNCIKMPEKLMLLCYCQDKKYADLMITLWNCPKWRSTIIPEMGHKYSFNNVLPVFVTTPTSWVYTNTLS